MMHNVVAGFLFFFITCAIYLHSRVILLKQDLAIFLFCSQLAAIGSSVLKLTSTRQNDGWLLPQSTQNNPLPFILISRHNRIYPINSHSSIKCSVEELTVFKELGQLSIFHSYLPLSISKYIFFLSCESLFSLFLLFAFKMLILIPFPNSYTQFRKTTQLFRL